MGFMHLMLVSGDHLQCLVHAVHVCLSLFNSKSIHCHVGFCEEKDTPHTWFEMEP